MTAVPGHWEQAWPLHEGRYPCSQGDACIIPADLALHESHESPVDIDDTHIVAGDPETPPLLITISPTDATPLVISNNGKTSL